MNKIVLKWKRPDSIEYPKVWHRFKARDLETDKLVEYRIEDLLENRAEEAYKHMRENYFQDEPVSKAMGGGSDRNHFEDYKYGWQSLLDQKTPIVCYREGSNEIVGINWTFVINKDDAFFEQVLSKSKSQVTKCIFGLAFKLYENFDPFKHYGVDEYMASMGLSVDKKYRGRAIGDHFLAARKAICQEFGVKLTHTIFSSDYSSRNAEKVGFKLDCSIRYDEVEKTYPEYSLPPIESAELSLKTLLY